MSAHTIKMVLDTRESGRTKRQIHKQCDCTEDALAVGDIVINDVVCIEHKIPADFIASVFDGRLFSQIASMTASYPHNYIMVSGSMADIMRIADRSKSRAAITSALCSCFVRGCPIIFCGSVNLLVEVAKGLATKHGDGKPRDKPVERHTLEDKRYQLLCSIEGVSYNVAVALLDKYGSVEHVFKASESDLLKIPHIGPVTAANIRSVLE
jgi:ERCC4-type nuclease